MTVTSATVRFFAMIAALLIAAAGSGCAGLHDAFRGHNGSPAPSPSPGPPQANPESFQSVHIAFGIPSRASQDPNNEDDFLVVGVGHVLSFNNSRGTANWAAWRTTRADVGGRLPRPDFRPDPRLPRWYKRIGPFDYSGSDYDRGHLVPSADRFANPRLNEETFLMTNIVPQTESLNQHPWNDFENYVRGQVRRGFDAYQIAGVYGDRGRLREKITIPSNCWKIVVLVPRDRKPGGLDPRARIIAVDMPNDDGLDNVSWQRFRTTVRRIEEKTGLDFFSTAPRQQQDLVETRMEMANPR